ncbi:MAG: hypothetical protein RIQ33_2497 [Bacteroidota bacterium]|jgi:GNAT superfamily N-acetyltransferase
MQTRLATINDSPIISAFNKAIAFETEHKTLPDEIALLGVENLIKQPQYGFYIVHEIDEKIIASIMITYEWSDWQNELVWWIQSVYVKPTHRKQGVFKQMLLFIEQLAKQQSINSLKLYMEKENKVAHQVYLKNNFIETDYLLFQKNSADVTISFHHHSNHFLGLLNLICFGRIACISLKNEKFWSGKVLFLGEYLNDLFSEKGIFIF